MHIGIRVFLLAGPLGPVALGIGHGNAQGEVARLNVVQIVEKTRMVVGPVIGIRQLGRLKQRIQTILGQVALGATGFGAHQPDGFQLMQQVSGTFVDMQHPVDLLSGSALGCRQQCRVAGIAGKVIGYPYSRDAGGQERFIHHTVHLSAIDKHPGLIAPQGLTILSCRHQHGKTLKCFFADTI